MFCRSGDGEWKPVRFLVLYSCYPNLNGVVCFIFRITAMHYISDVYLGVTVFEWEAVLHARVGLRWKENWKEEEGRDSKLKHFIFNSPVHVKLLL